MKFVVPEFKKDGFHCPLCGVFAHMTWEELSSHRHSTMYHEARCSCCKQPSLWRVTEYVNGQFGRSDRAGELMPTAKAVLHKLKRDWPLAKIASLVQ
ncbi:hypothetical protein DDN43_17865 [Vibrio cholerae]|nr:hypothetical protein [Vibrio cholerae]